MERRQQSLRRRLTALVVVAIFGAVAIVTLSSVWRETAQFGAGKRAELYASANIFAAAVAEPLVEKRSGEAALALRAASYIPAIDYISVEDASGAIFAEHGAAPDPSRARGLSVVPDSSPLALLLSPHIIVRAPVIYNDAPIGSLTLHAETASLSERIALLLYDALVAAIFAGGIGVLIALRMQRTITDPIQSLARVMSQVRESGDFAVRAEGAPDEETAQLVDTFNTMLDHIQERDARLHAHQRNLKKIVEQRTREMRSAKEAAEAANMAKSDFLATMSHEIRTPLNGMLAMADMLSKARLAPRQKRYAEVIAKSGQSLLAIINDILDFSKIEAGKLEFEKIPVRPATIVDDVVSLFWERASSKNIDLASYVSPDVPEEIEADPVRLTQVLSNLVNNAMKFTERGHVVVSIDCKPAPGAPGHTVLEISVTDTGVGIAQEKQPTIFEAFSQADQTTTRRFGGTGLGLAICRRLVEAMGGVMGVTSKPAKGSRFWFSFTAKTVSPARKVRRAHGDKRALISVNGDATAKMLARYLREAGISTHIVDLAEPLGPHLAYADMLFASASFYSAYERAIRNRGAQWIPARICIAELGDTAPDRLIESGVVEDILLAPLSRRDVMDQIARALDNTFRGVSALSTSEAPAPTHQRFCGQRVLAADDSAVNREVVSEALRRLNLSVTLAADGREALALAEIEEFSLILMDCSMPEMDGFEATRAIRELEKRERRAAAPIIALTAHVAGAGNEWRAAGMNDYLTKPFTLDSLAAALAKHLEIDAEAAAFDDDDADAPAASKTPAAVAMSAPAFAETDTFAADVPAPGPSATTPSAEEPIGRDVLEQIAAMQAGGVNLPVRTLTLFEEHSRIAMRALVESFKTGERDAIASAAHAIKSMSANIGARALAAACGAIEERAKSGAPLDELSALCKAAALDFRAAHKALPGLIEEYNKRAA